MRKTRATAAMLLVLAAGCVPPGPDPSGTPNPSMSISSSPSPSPTPTPSHQLTDEQISEVVKELMTAAHHRRALKLDVTESRVILTVLGPDNRVAAYRWLDGEITEVDSDVQFMGQAGFNPLDFPLDDFRQLMRTAAQMGAGPNEQILQIQEYPDQKFYITVSARSGGETIFFDAQGTLIPVLTTTDPDDIAAGLAAVAGETEEVVELGISHERGFWADVVAEPGVLERRVRKDGIPTITSRRSDGREPVLIDPARINPQALANRQEILGGNCTVTGRSESSTGAVLLFQCADGSATTSFEGTILSTDE